MIDTIISKYVISFYCIIGAILNIINFIIFSSENENFKKPIYQYLKMNSIADGVNSFILTISPFIFSDSTLSYTSFSHSYYYKLYHFYIALYFARVLNTFSSFINIRLAFKRFISLKYQDLNYRTRIEEIKLVKVYSVLFFLTSAILHSPNIFLYRISKKLMDIQNHTNSTNTFYYKIEFSRIGENNKNLFTVLFSIKFVVTITNLIAMIVISIKTFIYIRKRCHISFNDIALFSRNNNSETTVARTVENDKVFKRLRYLENQTNKMILGMSTIFIINEFITTAGSILEFMNRTKEVKLRYTWVFIVVVVSYISNCSLNTFLYLKYSKAFSDKFKKIFKFKK